eukprot:scaffold4404_cov383-Prasinococcus_capsulatus_cf.AAC.1
MCILRPPDPATPAHADGGALPCGGSRWSTGWRGAWHASSGPLSWPSRCANASCPVATRIIATVLTRPPTRCLVRPCLRRAAPPTCQRAQHAR